MFSKKSETLSKVIQHEKNKKLVSGCQSTDMHCITLPVTFDGGLSISFLKNKQLLPKKGEGPKITFSNSSDFPSHFGAAHEISDSFP
jgi:hypothetical protein